jgi:hypothetical protein
MDENEVEFKHGVSGGDSIQSQMDIEGPLLLEIKSHDSIISM